jgi:hypothetical protein
MGIAMAVSGLRDCRSAERERCCAEDEKYLFHSPTIVAVTC